MKPLQTTDLDMAFGPKNIHEFLPDYRNIPEDFKIHQGNKWSRLISEWFFRGLPEGTGFIPKEGIDAQVALKHVSATLRSFQPKHEHKEAGCAFLMSEWFEDVVDAEGKSILED